MAERWIILRCQAGRTLTLAEALGQDGFTVWAPVHTRTVTIPRVNVKREVTTAMLPGFVFATERHLVDLLGIAAMPVKPRRGPSCQMPALPDFSVLRCGERIALVREAGLEELRKFEASRRRRPKAPSLPKGSRVRVSPDEPRGFGGMHGIVRRSDETATLVCFSAWFDKVEIATSLLSLDEAYELPSETDTAAREAA